MSFFLKWRVTNVKLQLQLQITMVQHNLTVVCDQVKIL